MLMKYEGKVKISWPNPKRAFQLVKVYVSCMCAQVISSYDKLELVAQVVCVNKSLK